jgi:hypothetical protein
LQRRSKRSIPSIAISKLKPFISTNNFQLNRQLPKHTFLYTSKHDVFYLTTSDLSLL